MELYKINSLINIFIIYFIACIPSFFILFRKKTYENKKTFIKKISLSVFIEITIFIVFHFSANTIISFFSSKTNIQNYTLYCSKILFIASSISVIHFAIPLYFYFNKNIKKGIKLFFIKILYLPIMFLAYLLFNTKGIYFSIPLCDILYTIFLLYIFLLYIFKFTKHN